MLLSMNIKSYEQQTFNIRFIHGGEELKPVGTLSISVAKLIKPTDRDMDNIYGKAVKTDEKSFNIVMDFVRGNKYLNTNPQKLRGNREYYKIIIVSQTNSNILYLGEKNIIVFFGTMRSLLINHKADPNLIDILKYY